MTAGADTSGVALVLADWGTSNLRAWALDNDGSVVATNRSGAGMRTLNRDEFALVLETCVAELGGSADTPVLMCGMVGSRQGWQEAAYADVPVSLRDLADKHTPVDGTARPAAILPGVCKREAVAPDVMRSEETQLLGVAATGRLHEAETLVCMPGSHAKWVRLSGDVIVDFHTAMSGELVAAAASHTVLRHSVPDPLPTIDPLNPVLLEAIERARNGGVEAGLLADLFTLRGRNLINGEDGAASAAWLSGCVIGHDVAAGLSRYAVPGRVVLIGGGAQGPLYEQALRMHGHKPVVLDGEAVAIAGLTDAATSIWPGIISTAAPSSSPMIVESTHL